MTLTGLLLFGSAGIKVRTGLSASHSGAGSGFRIRSGLGLGFRMDTWSILLGEDPDPWPEPTGVIIAKDLFSNWPFKNNPHKNLVFACVWDISDPITEVFQMRQFFFFLIRFLK